MKLVCLFFFIFYQLSVASAAGSSLQVGFYNHSCPHAEAIVHSVILKHFESDRSITAALLRMYFHDCFVRGCDASILINPTKKKESEKNAGPNTSVRGYGVIEKAKRRVEAVCPGTVSCADIIALATRDAVLLSGGLHYSVPTGRKDGRESNPEDVVLPGPDMPVKQAFQLFAAKGFTVHDMVILVGGGHSVGISQCSFFRDRLFDFQGTGKPDPTMDSTLRSKLIKLCGPTAKPGSVDPVAFLDQGTSFTVDNQFFTEITKGRGILKIDQELALDNSTSRIVSSLSKDKAGFQMKFANALVKLGNLDVLVGNAGEIRKTCGVVNRQSKSVGEVK